MQYQDIKLRSKLSEAEARQQYADFYYRNMAKPAPEAFDQVKLLDERDVLLIKDVNRLLEPGYLPGETGYCLLPDGTGYVANRMDMRGVTPEMFDWWFAWHGLSPLRYKIWDPDDHFDLTVDEVSRERLLNKQIPVRERIWGVTHTVAENQLRDLKISFISPADFGFDMSRFPSPSEATAICTQKGLCHYVRRTETGSELRTRFWFGWHIENGQRTKIPLTRTQEALKSLNLHNIKEFTNLAAILPALYDRMHGQIEPDIP